MKSITIEGQLRTETGKKITRRLRSQGLVPGVIYGGSQEVNFAAPVLAFKNLVYTSEFQLAEIKIDGKSYRCILKDIQLNKVTDELAHWISWNLLKTGKSLQPSQSNSQERP